MRHKLHVSYHAETRARNFDLGLNVLHRRLNHRLIARFDPTGVRPSAINDKKEIREDNFDCR
jgi:hypothetical protein